MPEVFSKKKRRQRMEGRREEKGKRGEGGGGDLAGVEALKYYIFFDCMMSWPSQRREQDKKQDPRR